LKAAERAGVDRPTIVKLRSVAKHGAFDALAASRPGVRQGRVDPELAAPRAEIARLSEALKEIGVRLMLTEGKERCARACKGQHSSWLSPAARGLKLADPAPRRLARPQRRARSVTNAPPARRVPRAARRPIPLPARHESCADRSAGGESRRGFVNPLGIGVQTRLGVLAEQAGDAIGDRAG